MEKQSTSRKWELLGALYKNGCKLERLREDLPDWDDSEIEKAIKSYRTRAVRNLQSSQAEGTKEPIDMWHDFIEKCQQIEGTTPVDNKKRKIDGIKNYSPLLQKIMMYAAAFEEHYQGKSPEEPNYNEIYRYFSQLLAGEEPTQLRPGNARKIVEMMSKLKRLLDSKDSIQRYLNYISDKHSVSYLKPGVDVWSIIEEKKNKGPEIDVNEVSQLFNEKDVSEGKLASLKESDPQYGMKKEKIILKLSLKQRALAGTISHIPGLNPLEMVLPSLVKPPMSLLQASENNPKKRKISDN